MLRLLAYHPHDLALHLPSVLLIIPAAQSSEPLPENPEGAALLEARIEEIAQLETYLVN